MTQLTGDLTLPLGLTHAVGALLMVPGGWFAERDGFLGDSYTDADLMFLRIASRVRDAGFVVARFDNRGVTGNELSIGLKKDSPDPEGDTKTYLDKCVNSEIRKTVTPETLTSDVATVYQFLSRHSAVDRANIVIFAHSEGGIHVARLIGGHRINPKGVVFAGSTTGSPCDVMKWQMVDRYVDEVMRWDRDGDGRVLPNDIEECFGTSFLAEVGISEQELYSECQGWTEPDARKYFAAQYEEQKSTALGCPDDMPFPRSDDGHVDYVAASYRWLKTFFTDKTSMISLLHNYAGRVSYHFGDIDRQLPFSAEMNNIKAHAKSMACDPRTVVHRQRGHAFCSNKAVNGPMDFEAEDIFANDLVSMLRTNF